MPMTDRRIVLVRHGRTDWNNEGRFQGLTDIPLNDEGRRQSEALARRLQSWPPGIILTSPLARAYETAEIIASQFGMKPSVLDELREIDFGEWEGEKLDDVHGMYCREYIMWMTDPFFNPPPYGECWYDIEARLNIAMSIITSCPYERVAVVTHGGVIRALFAVMLGYSPHRSWYIDVPNCSLSGIEASGGNIYLSFANDCFHISAGAEGEALPVWSDEK